MAQSETILLQTNTDIEHYEVVDRTYEGRPARVLFSGAKRSAQSGIGLDDNSDLLFDYNQRLLELVNALYPRRVLVIGGGVFTLPMALVGALPDVAVDVIELDAGLESIAQEYFGLTADERLHINFGDGRDFLEASVEKYDVIILDVFSELAIPPKFLTQEFVSLLHAHLTDSGTVAMNIIASYQGRNAGLIKSQVAAYRVIFGDVTLFPAAYGLTSWLPQNLVLVAQKNPKPEIAQYVRYAPIGPLETEQSDILHDEN